MSLRSHSTIVTTEPGSASPGLVAFAAGQITSTKTQTHTISGSGLSFADAKASAFARTENNIT
jgi:hypothetical protein